jgi:hypothetical protein
VVGAGRAVARPRRASHGRLRTRAPLRGRAPQRRGLDRPRGRAYTRPRPHDGRPPQRSLRFDLRRTREGETPGGSVRQAFFRMGQSILEVVLAPDRTKLAADPNGPARLWGISFLVQDLSATAEALGDRLGTPRDAVQPGRKIATLRREAGLGPAVAFMTPGGGAISRRLRPARSPALRRARSARRSPSTPRQADGRVCVRPCPDGCRSRDPASPRASWRRTPSPRPRRCPLRP